MEQHQHTALPHPPAKCGRYIAGIHTHTTSRLHYTRRKTYFVKRNGHPNVQQHKYRFVRCRTAWRYIIMCLGYVTDVAHISRTQLRGDLCVYIVFIQCVYSLIAAREECARGMHQFKWSCIWVMYVCACVCVNCFNKTIKTFATTHFGTRYATDSHRSWYSFKNMLGLICRGFKQCCF